MKPKCPHCGATVIVVASIWGGNDPHETFKCNAWKRCGKYFRIPNRR